MMIIEFFIEHLDLIANRLTSNVISLRFCLALHTTLGTQAGLLFNLFLVAINYLRARY